MERQPPPPATLHSEGTAPPPLPRTLALLPVGHPQGLYRGPSCFSVPPHKLAAHGGPSFTIPAGSSSFPGDLGAAPAFRGGSDSDRTTSGAGKEGNEGE